MIAGISPLPNVKGHFQTVTVTGESGSLAAMRHQALSIGEITQNRVYQASVEQNLFKSSIFSSESRAMIHDS
jgi:hypothetical protein